MDAREMESRAADAAALLSAIGNSNRLMVLCNLMDAELPVQVLANRVGMNQSALSQQLAKLRALKLVSTRRDGRTIYYRMASEKASRILGTLYSIYCDPDAG